MRAVLWVVVWVDCWVGNLVVYLVGSLVERMDPLVVAWWVFEKDGQMVVLKVVILVYL